MTKNHRHIATPPGQTIREQMDDRHMDRKELAARLSISEECLDRL